MSLLNKLLNTQAATAADAEGAYQKLVESFANDGPDPSLDHVNKTLQASDRTAQQLADDVAARKRELAQHEEVRLAEQALAELPALNQRIADADAVLNAAHRKHAETVLPLRYRISDINQQNLQAEGARRWLRELESKRNPTPPRRPRPPAVQRERSAGDMWRKS